MVVNILCIWTKERIHAKMTEVFCDGELPGAWWIDHEMVTREKDQLYAFQTAAILRTYTLYVAAVRIVSLLLAVLVMLHTYLFLLGVAVVDTYYGYRAFVYIRPYAAILARYAV